MGRISRKKLPKKSIEKEKEAIIACNFQLRGASRPSDAKKKKKHRHYAPSSIWSGHDFLPFPMDERKRERESARLRGKGREFRRKGKVA